MKKQQQLGLNPSTASYRLIKDLLFRYVIEAGHKCHRCGGDLLRKNFSVEHKIPWLDSHDPVGLFFDLDNIAFSHRSCNSSAGGKGPKRKFTPEEAARRVKESKRRHWTSAKRREHYLRTGN